MDSRYTVVFFIFMSIFLLAANTSYVTLDVVNNFPSPNDIEFTVGTEMGQYRPTQIVPLGGNMSWRIPWRKDNACSINHLCTVKELVEEDSKTNLVGSFIVFSAAWHCERWLPETDIKYKWLVNEEGAAIFDFKTGQYRLVHPWKLNFFVENNFQSRREIGLRAINEQHPVAEGKFPFGNGLHWIHRLGPRRRSFKYTCHVLSVAEINFLHTFNIHVSSLHENPSETSYVRTAYWYRVNESGLEAFNFITGHYEWIFGWEPS